MFIKIRIIIIAVLFIILASPESSAQYPLKFNAGVAAGGTGLFGIPIQLRPAKFMALDLGIYFRTVNADAFENTWFFGPAADFGIDLFLSRKENVEKSRTREHGFYIKGAYGLHKKEDDDLLRLRERSAGFGWVMEVSNHEHPHRKFQIQLGPSLIQNKEAFLNTRYPPGYQLQNEDYFSGMIYARLSWFIISN